MAPTRETLLAAGRRHLWTALFAAASAALVAWVARDAFGARAITHSQGSDYWEHAGAVQALLRAPLSPGNPAVDSPALSPRYTPIFLALAALGRGLGWDALDVLSAASVLNVSLFAAGVFFFFGHYFGDRRAPLLALIVLLGSWWEGWHFSNVYQLQMLPSVASYPSMTALGLTWLCFGQAIRVLRGQHHPGQWTALGVLCALVVLVHPLTASMTYAGLAFAALLEPGPTPKTRLGVLAVMLGGALLTHFWPYYSPFDVVLGARGKDAGWLGRALSGSAPRKLHMFYNFRGLLRAFGVGLLGVGFSVVLLARRVHLFVPLGAAVTLGVFCTNAFVPLPLGHRFVLLAMVFVHIALVWGCLQLLPGSARAPSQGGERWLRAGARWGLLALLLVAARHNLSAASARLARVPARSSSVVAYARKASALSQGGVVLGRPRASWPLPAFGGKVVTLHHANPLVPDRAERNAAAARFFAWKASAQEREKILRKYGVTHVLTSRKDERRVKAFLAKRGKATGLAGGYRIYALHARAGT